MKKSVKIMLTAALAVMTLAGCKKENRENQFVFGLDASFPPLGYTLSDGTITGYDVDLGKEVASRLGLEFVIKPINWAAKEMELETESIDCIWSGFTMSEERMNAMAFTPAYLNNDQVLVVRKDSGINSLKDAAGKVIGYQAGSSAEDAVNDNPEFRDSVKSFKKYEENLIALTDLEIGGIDGVVMDSVVADWAIKEGSKPLVFVDEILAKEAYGVGFKKSEKGQALRDKIWNTLKEMQADGTASRISNKWFGKDLSIIGQ